MDDDSSISKRHLTLEVVLTPLPGELPKPGTVEGDYLASIVITDTSENGTELFHPADNNNHDSNKGRLEGGAVQGGGVVPLRVKLSRGESFCVPVNSALWQEFSVTLGLHGATFSLQRSPMRVLTLGHSSEQVSECLRRCGAVAVTDVVTADYLLTSRLSVTPSVIAMLCRAASHIVTPDYFQTVQECCGDNTQPALEDPRAFLPCVDDTWSSLLHDKDSGFPAPTDSATSPAGRTSSDLAAVLLDPLMKVRRQQLFANTTFTIVQQSLYEEVQVFLPFTRGCAVLDLSLFSVVHEYEKCRRGLLRRFHAKHRDHIILYNSREELPIQNFLQVLQGAMGIRCTELMNLVRSVLWLTPLLVPPLETDAALAREWNQWLGGEGQVGEIAKRGKSLEGSRESGQQCANYGQEEQAKDGHEERDRCQKVGDKQSTSEKENEDQWRSECYRPTQCVVERVGSEKEQVDGSNMVLTQIKVCSLDVTPKRIRVTDGFTGHATGMDPFCQGSWTDGHMNELGSDGAVGRRQQHLQEVGVDGWIHRKPCFTGVGMDVVTQKGLPSPPFANPKHYTPSFVASATNGGKWFKKQRLAECKEKVKLNRSESAVWTGSLSRKLDVDDMDIVPDVVSAAALTGLPQCGKRCAAGKPAPPRKRWPKSVASAASTADSNGSRRVSLRPTIDIESAELTLTNRTQMYEGMGLLNDVSPRPKRARSPLSVFDLEALL